MYRPTANKACYQTIVIQTSPTAVAYEALTSKVSCLVLRIRITIMELELCFQLVVYIVSQIICFHGRGEIKF